MNLDSFASRPYELLEGFAQHRRNNYAAPWETTMPHLENREMGPEWEFKLHDLVSVSVLVLGLIICGEGNS